MNIYTLFDKISNKPKVVFLLDGIGALLSALFIFIIRTYFENQIGLPTRILSFLIFMAVLLSIFSFSCFLFQIKNLKRSLKIISKANILYSILTIITLFSYRQSITKLGLLYFILEIFIIFIIVKMELKTIYKLNDKWANG